MMVLQKIDFGQWEGTVWLDKAIFRELVENYLVAHPGLVINITEFLRGDVEGNA